MIKWYNGGVIYLAPVRLPGAWKKGFFLPAQGRHPDGERTKPTCLFKE